MNNKPGNSRWLGMSVGAAMLICGRGTPAAQSGSTEGAELEEIVITAERRETDLQKTALSVTAVTAEHVEKTGITTYDTLLESIPGVQVQAPQGPQATPYIAIRGLGTDGDNKPGATAIYLDGIVIGAMGLQLYDLARVEVLRGPQGTLYGGVATGGAVNIISNDPSLTGYSGSALLEVGNYDLVHAVGVVNAPLSDTTALRLAINGYRRGSYSDPSSSQQNQLNARGKLLFRPSDDFSLLLGTELYLASGVLNDGTQSQDDAGHLIGSYNPTLGYSEQKGYKGYANINWNVGFGTLTSITAIQKFHADVSTADANGAGYTQTPRRDTTTEELRLASNPDSKLTWVGGVFYRDYQQRDTVNIGALSVLPPDSQVPGPGGTLTDNILISVPESRDDQSLGLFGQVTVPLTAATRATGGVRYSKDDIHFDQFLTWTTSAFVPPFLCAPTDAPCEVPTLFKHSFTSTDWLARIEHDLADGKLVYAMASTGYRPGGPSAPRGSVNDAPATYDAERVRAYEIGSKNRFAGNRVQLNGAIYYNDYPSFQNNTTLYGPNNSQLPAIVPVAAKFYGAELELQALLTPDDRLSASGSYIHATFTENATVTDSFSGDTFSLSTKGGQVPHAPKVQGNLAYDHTFRLGSGARVVGTANAHYQDLQAVAFNGCLYSADACTAGGTTYQKLTQPSYTLLDASLTFNSANDMLAVTAYCRNLTDETIKIASGRGGLASLAAPRTVGLVFNVKF